MYSFRSTKDYLNEYMLKNNIFYFNGGNIIGGVVYINSQKYLLLEHNIFGFNKGKYGAIIALH